MVEMAETASIMNSATPRSFVIVDEVGRGTSPEDGIALAYAVLHWLHHKNKCRLLYSTHFHQLSDILADEAFKSLEFYKMAAVEEKVSRIHVLEIGIYANTGFF